MAKKPVTYDDNAIYGVKLMRAVSYRGATLLPLPFHEMTGRAVAAIIEQEGPDVVDTAISR